MKKISIVFVACLFSFAVQAQKAADLFSSTQSITWLGIDFSNVKLIGDFSQFAGAGQTGPAQVKAQYFSSWNTLVLNEPRKYDLRGAFRKNDVTLLYDIEMVTKINAGTKVETLTATNTPNYSKDKISAIVKKYPLKGKQGLGVVFIAETLNKSYEEAYFHVVILNMATKEILIQERVRSQPMGIGVRNYWAGAIANAIKNIENPYYKSWKQKYAK